MRPFLSSENLKSMWVDQNDQLCQSSEWHGSSVQSLELLGPDFHPFRYNLNEVQSDSEIFRSTEYRQNPIINNKKSIIFRTVVANPINFFSLYFQFLLLSPSRVSYI